MIKLSLFPAVKIRQFCPDYLTRAFAKFAKMINDSRQLFKSYNFSTTNCFFEPRFSESGKFKLNRANLSTIAQEAINKHYGMKRGDFVCFFAKIGYFWPGCLTIAFDFRHYSKSCFFFSRLQLSRAMFCIEESNFKIGSTVQTYTLGHDRSSFFDTFMISPKIRHFFQSALQS